jgi:preprotein translocase subunit Sss1
MIMPQRTPQEAKRAVLRAEAIGILILLVVGFILILLRYGRFIDWHVR